MSLYLQQNPQSLVARRILGHWQATNGEADAAIETLEETGIRVRDIRYIASQPWPFPSSLMIACVARAENDEIVLDRNELEDALWFTRDEVRAALAGDPDARFVAPPTYAIAHTLLTAWVEGD